MKKIIYILTLFFNVVVFGQNPGNFNYVVVQDSFYLNGVWYSDTLATKAYADTTGGSTDSSWVKIDVQHIDFDTASGEPTYKKGRVFYDEGCGCFVSMVNNSQVRLQNGQELWEYGINATGTEILNEEVLYIKGRDINGYPKFHRAIANTRNIINQTVIIATQNIGVGELGYGTKIGHLTTNTSACNVGDKLFLSPYDSSGLTNIQPMVPNYPYQIAIVESVGVNGIIDVNISPFNATETAIASEGIFNGLIIQKQSISDTVISNIPYFETNNEENDTVDLPFMYGGYLFTLNTTSNIGRNGSARVSLVWGTATEAQRNYIYIDNSGTPTLSSNTTGFAGDHIPLAICDILNEAEHLEHGFTSFQRFDNSLNGSNANGWVNKSGKRTRKNGSIFESGLDQTFTIDPAGSPDSLRFLVTAGLGWQFNLQNLNSLDGRDILWLNDPNAVGGLTWINDLNEITVDANNGSLRGNNTRYGLNIFYIIRSGSYGGYLAVTTPNDSYNIDASAISDALNYAVTNPPTQLRQTAIRVARVVVNYNSDGTFDNLLGAGNFQDERGFVLGSSAGSGSSSSAITEFSDADINIYNSLDPTKVMNFDMSGLTTGTINTFTMTQDSYLPYGFFEGTVDPTDLTRLNLDRALYPTRIDIEDATFDSYLTSSELRLNDAINSDYTSITNNDIKIWDNLNLRTRIEYDASGSNTPFHFHASIARDPDIPTFRVVDVANTLFTADPDTFDIYNLTLKVPELSIGGSAAIDTVTDLEDIAFIGGEFDADAIASYDKIFVIGWDSTGLKKDTIPIIPDPGGGGVSLGTVSQIPFMNVAGTDYDYTDNFKWNGSDLKIINGGLDISLTSGDTYRLLAGATRTRLYVNGVVRTLLDPSTSYVLDCENVRGVGENILELKEAGVSKYSFSPTTLTISEVINIPPSSTPSSPSEGDVYMDSTTHTLRVFDGTSWQDCW